MVLDPRYQEDYHQTYLSHSNSGPFTIQTTLDHSKYRLVQIQIPTVFINGLKLPKAIINPNGADFESHLNTERTPFHSNTTHSGPVFWAIAKKLGHNYTYNH